MRLTGLVDSARGLTPHGHLCWTYQDRAEFRKCAGEYAADALGEGQWVEYVGAGTPGQLRAELTDLDGVDEAAAASDGDIGVMPVEDFYAFTGHTDVIDPEASVTKRVTATEKALAAGYTGFRAVVDSTPVARTPEQRATLAQFEYLVDRKMAILPLSALCAYNAAELGAAAVAEFACLHPLASPGSTPFRLYADPEADGALAGEIDLGSAELFATTLGQTVRGSAGSAPAADGEQDVHLDVSQLGFIDVPGTRALVQAAEGLESGRLVLHGAGYVPRTVLRVSGWDQLADVVVEDA